MRTLPNTHWIWLPDFQEKVADKPTLVRFRKVFSLDSVPQSFKINISADTRYKLYVNGRLAEFGPARSFPQTWYYDTVDLAPWLRAGENVVAMEVLRYPLAYRSGYFGLIRSATPGLFLESQDGSFFADESYQCMAVPGFAILRESPGFSPLMYLEEYRADGYDRGWKDLNYDDSGWTAARPYNVFEINTAAIPGDLSPREIPYMRKDPRRFQGLVPKYDGETMSAWGMLLGGTGAVTIPANSKITVELNAGAENCGFLSLALARGAGARIEILCSEGYVQPELHPNGHAPLKKDRCDWVRGHLEGYTDIYHAAGFGTDSEPEIYEPFWFRTFRFVALTIETRQEPLTLHRFDYLETGYPLQVKTSVSASDPSFGGIWDISLRSLKLCMHETYYDCPFYEQLQYAMDSRSQILYTYMLSGDDRLARQCMESFRLSQRPDGMLNCTYPHWGPNIIPGFGIYYILMVYDHMMYFGDKDLIRHHLGAIDAVLNYFQDHLDKRGMVGKTGGHISERYWSFIDWATAWGKTVGTPPAGLTGPITMESFLYIYGLQHAARLCDYMGRTGTAAEYRTRANAVQQALKQHCRDEAGFFLDSPGVREYSQHCQVFAMLTDTVDPAEGKRLLMPTFTETEKFAQCTVASMFYLFRALETVGEYRLTDGLWDTWRNMLRNNLTTCVENYVDERSDCHAWGALLLHELPGVILGVRPTEPGYGKVSIQPVPGYLDWAKGDVVTPKGMVHVEWTKQEDGTLKLEYTLPEGLEIG